MLCGLWWVWEVGGGSGIGDIAWIAVVAAAWCGVVSVSVSVCGVWAVRSAGWWWWWWRRRRRRRQWCWCARVGAASTAVRRLLEVLLRSSVFSVVDLIVLDKRGTGINWAIKARLQQKVGGCVRGHPRICCYRRPG